MIFENLRQDYLWSLAALHYSFHSWDIYHSILIEKWVVNKLINRKVIRLKGAVYLWCKTYLKRGGGVVSFLKKIISPELFGVFGVATKREAELKSGEKSYGSVEDDDDDEDGVDDDFNWVGLQDPFPDLGCLSLGWMDLQYFLNVHCMMQLHNAKEFSHLKI